ncbi:hypothetical protein [Streptomyces sp. N35]|uniref:hypothetical protein n=1 Tax=Streptomyces sp. N35 TaxID=2795730 RepID=UPI0018F43E36|nr:hypothetical protein [Streptomyces sp. N35]
MSDLDFYADVATRGDVLGVGRGSSPEMWEAALGPDFLDDPGRGMLRRDYGLVELSFSSVEGVMSCFGIGVQVHRMLHGLRAPTAVVRAYGEFAPRVPFGELRTRIRSLGCEVEPEDVTGDVHRYRVPESGARIFVVEDPDPYGHAEGDHDADAPALHRVGDVWAVYPIW